MVKIALVVPEISSPTERQTDTPTETFITILYSSSRNGVCTWCSGCGGDLKEVNGTFASPSFPNAATTSFTCRWKIHVPARRNVNLRLTVTQAPSAGGGGCPSSYVQVLVSTDGGPPITELGRYCTAVSQPYTATIWEGCSSRALA